MKKISLILVFALIVSMVLPFGVLAASTDFTMSYDFDDYEATVGSGTGPDSEWSYFKGGKAFGGEDGTLKINSGGIPSLKLTNPVACNTSPKDAMVISFKAKTAATFVVGTVKNYGDHNGDITNIAVTSRARHNMMKIYKSKIIWYQKARDGSNTTAYTWTRPEADGDWHKYDIYRKKDGSLLFYVDGVDITKGVGVSAEHNWGGNGGSAFSQLYFNAMDGGATYVDDLKVRVERDKLSNLAMTKIGDERVERSNGVLALSFNEPVDATSIEKDSFVISNNVTGDVVTDFEIELDELNGVADGVTINFGENTLISGDYTVSLDESITGMLTGTVASKFVFKPAYKKTNGVIHPEAESVEFINIDGEAVKLSNEVTAGIKEIIVKFNTLIDATNIEDYVTLEDESGPVDTIEYIVEDEGENSILTIKVKELLKPHEKYKFVISKGIPALANAEVMSENDDRYSFKTAMPDQGGSVFGIIRNEVVREENTYYFGVAKTVEKDVKVWAIAAAYMTMIDENGEEYERLIECKYFPVVLDADDIGTFEFEDTFETDLSDTGISVKTFLNEYPTLLPLNI